MSIQSEQIAVEPRHNFEIRLLSTPSTGYIWTIESCPVELQLLEAGADQAQRLPLVGGSVNQTFRFQSTVPGQYSVKFVLKRHWETAIARRHEVHVIVA